MTTQSLLEQGVDKNETTNFERSAMWYAAENGYLEIVRLLVEQGAVKDKADLNEQTPLYDDFSHPPGGESPEGQSARQTPGGKNPLFLCPPGC